MKLHKTSQKQRDTYSYQFFDADGKPEPRIVIRPGENDVTEVDIKNLHDRDDSEVYYNIRARRPEEDELQKAQKAAWRERYISDFIAEHGYKPHKQDVEDAVNEAFPKNWVASLDELLDGTGDEDGYGDKSAALAGLCTSDDSGESPQVERSRELVAGMTEKEQVVYWRVIINGETKRSVATVLGLSDVRITQITRKIMTRIKEDKILQSFFR